MSIDLEPHGFAEAPDLQTAAQELNPTRWRLQHYLTVVAVVFLFWGAWTVIAWLGDDPAAITANRDPDSAAYSIAKGWEIFFVAVAVLLGSWVIRGCLRERRLTFDAQLCIAGALAFWLDPFYNFLVPTNLFSSNFVNVGSWCGHAPLVVNKACGEVPTPLLVLGPIYLVGFLLAAIVGCWVMRTLSDRYPSMSMAKRLAILMAVAAFLGGAIDSSAMRLNLWNSFVSPDFTLFGDAHRYPLTFLLSAATYFGGPTLVRYFKDDRGRTVFERGLDHVRPRTRRFLSFMSLVGFVQLVVFAATVIFVSTWGLYAKDSTEYPDHIINEVCDIGDITGTAYGPCPGTPENDAPIRQLPNG